MMHIAPGSPQFSKRYQNLSVQIVIVNRNRDSIEAGIGCRDSHAGTRRRFGITARKPMDTPRVLAAAPGYLAVHGRPATPEALHEHRTLVYNLARDP